MQDIRVIKGQGLYSGPFLHQKVSKQSLKCKLAPCSEFHVQSNNQNGDTLFNNISPVDYNLYPQGNANHSTKETLFDSSTAIAFTGDGDYLRVDPLFGKLGTSPFMFEAWIYPTGNNKGTIISTTSWTGVGTEACEGETSYWSLYRDTDGSIIFQPKRCR
jgi:hypothetical protein